MSTQITAAINRLDDAQQVYDRIVVSDAMGQMVQLKPVMGWGYETLNANVAQYYRHVGEAFIPHGLVTSHNTYLTILTELGLIGILCYLFPTVWWLWHTLRILRWMPREGPGSRSLLVTFWLAILFNFVISNFMDMRWFLVGITLWWMTLGLIANLVDPYTGLNKIKYTHAENKNMPTSQA